MKKIDKKKIEEHIRGILEALGDNPDRPGLIDTPKRVANMYAEIFLGLAYTNDDIAEMYGVTFDEEDIYTEPGSDMVLMKDIDIFSHCEHHLSLMYNMTVAVAYIPKEKVIGLSKIARIADMVSRRPQLQERIGKDIAEIIKKVTQSDDVAVIIKGEHGCMTTRGIKKPGTKTITTTLRGRFKSEEALYSRLMELYRS